VTAPGRISRRFAALRAEGRGGLVAFVTAGDPDGETTAALLAGLPVAGADVIELGMPFSDPVADGPTIQAASVRALEAGASMRRTLELVRAFRADDSDTPIVLMGYFNPVYRYGVEAFSADAAAAGVDGLIIVDLPPEEEDELRGPAAAAGLDLIRLIAPTTSDERLPYLLEGASGFVYYVSITGVTGSGAASGGSVTAAVERLRRFTDLPVAVGFGIKTPAQAAEVARVADAAVVGSAFVAIIADNLEPDGSPAPAAVTGVLDLAKDLAAGVHSARGPNSGAGS